MVAVPHFMRERRKHSQTIVWLCHRNPFLLRIVFHPQTPPSSTSLRFKTCRARCHDNRAIGVGRPIETCDSPAHGEGRNLSFKPKRFVFPWGLFFPHFTWVPLRGAGSRGSDHRGRRPPLPAASGGRSHSRGFQLHSPENFVTRARRCS